MIFLRALLVLYVVCFWGGLTLWWQLDHLGNGHRPLEPGFFQWWHDLEGQPEVHLFEVQLTYPLLWWSARNAPWGRFWDLLRRVHFVSVIALAVLVLLLFLATPDLGGHWG